MDLNEEKSFTSFPSFRSFERKKNDFIEKIKPVFNILGHLIYVP